jgi:hypothetical protein
MNDAAKSAAVSRVFPHVTVCAVIVGKKGVLVFG